MTSLRNENDLLIGTTYDLSYRMISKKSTSIFKGAQAVEAPTSPISRGIKVISVLYGIFALIANCLRLIVLPKFLYTMLLMKLS